VDDFAVGSQDAWGRDSAALLLAACDRFALADSVAASASAARIAQRAAELGAVLAVVPVEPGSERAADLREEGWHIASEWYVGWPLIDDRAGGMWLSADGRAKRLASLRMDAPTTALNP